MATGSHKLQYSGARILHQNQERWILHELRSLTSLFLFSCLSVISVLSVCYSSALSVRCLSFLSFHEYFLYLNSSFLNLRFKPTKPDKSMDHRDPDVLVVLSVNLHFPTRFHILLRGLRNIFQLKVQYFREENVIGIKWILKFSLQYCIPSKICI